MQMSKGHTLRGDTEQTQASSDRSPRKQSLNVEMTMLVAPGAVGGTAVHLDAGTEL